MKKIRIGYWFSKFQLEDTVLDKLKDDLKLDVLISTEPENILEHTQYPYLEIREIEVTPKVNA